MSADLIHLREILTNLSIDAFVISNSDAHQSEYVATCEKRIKFISSFSGSSATAIVLADKAYLWTDGRYYTQAEQELSDEWTLMKSGLPDVLQPFDWLTVNLKEGNSVGIDARLFSASEIADFEKAAAKSKLKLIPVETNPIDTVWADRRPVAPSDKAFVLDIKFSGKSFSDKLKVVREKLTVHKCNLLAISALDEIAWLYNIRGSDVSYNPVVIAYSIVTSEEAFLFIDETKLTDDVRRHLDNDVKILPYDSMEEKLKELVTNNSIYLDPVSLNWHMYSVIKSSNPRHIVEKSSLLASLKCIKNEIELSGIRQCHIRDGVALTAFLAWLEDVIINKNATLTEHEISIKLEEFRSKMDFHVSPSFATIAGYGANGAIIHYRAKEECCSTLSKDSLFLLDSGGQYYDGTTDVTRTISFGDVSQRMRDCFTYVLKAHINLSRTVFPEGTLGSRIDSMARVPLWNAGLDFNHGTGHGVGHFLNVHEGPQGISFRQRKNEMGLFSGMTITNEPGYYEVGHFGIRIENICLVVPKETPNNFEGKKFCTLEPVTMCPIKQSLINKSLLNDAEVEWLNNYHKTVQMNLLEGMKTHFPEAVDYLIRETEEIK